MLVIIDSRENLALCHQKNGCNGAGKETAQEERNHAPTDNQHDEGVHEGCAMTVSFILRVIVVNTSVPSFYYRKKHDMINPF